MHRQQVLAHLLLLAISMGSCRKDKDDSSPTVKILSPAEGVTVSVPLNLTVRVQVTDDRIVKALTIDLLSETGAVVASAGSLSVDASSGTFERVLKINDERLSSGSYTIVARASDGENDARDHLRINVSEAPLRLRAIFLAPAFSTEAVTITKVDSLGVQSSWATVQDFNGIAVDSYWQHLIVAGSQWAPVQAIPTSPGSLPWLLSAPANDVPEQFTSVSVDPSDRRVYIATRDGQLRGFTGEGSQQFTAQCLLDHRCEMIVGMDDGVASYQRAIVGGDARIVTYTPAGTVLDQLPVEHEPIALFRRTGTSLVFFGNSGGSGVIEDLNITAGGSPERWQFTGETIRAVVRMDANTYAIALNDRLVRFNHPTITVSEIATGIAADAMAYEPANGSLLVAVGSDLLTIDPNTGTIIATLATGMPIGHVLPLLNR